MRKLLGHIGKDVVKFECMNFNIAVDLLNLMPNLEVLSLSHITDKQLKVPPAFRLKLPRLRSLAFKSCSLELIQIFNQLDDDILDELSLDVGVKFFKNQRNIKKMDGYVISLNYLILQQLRLEHVSLFSLNARTLESLKGQDKLVHAKFHNHNTRSPLNMKDLESLEVLHIHASFFNSLIDLSSNMKIRRVIIKRGFPSIKSEVLQELMYDDVRQYSRDELKQISLSCPNLRALRIGVVDIDSIFLLFPRLESLCCDGVSKLIQNSHHQHLKHFCVQSHGNCPQLKEQFDEFK
jgi:hypothetical protein